MMGLNSFYWGLYKDSDSGKSVIKEFAELGNDLEQWRIVDRYAPTYTKVVDEDTLIEFLESFCSYFEVNDIQINSFQDAKRVYEEIIDNGIQYDFSEDYFIPGGEYVLFYHNIIPFSIILYCRFPEYFFPYIFQYDIYPLVSLCDNYGIPMPEPPKKTDSRGRCMYYWLLCEVVYKFRTENHLTPEELCAFLYDFAPNSIRKTDVLIPNPDNVWCIGGLMSEIESSDSKPLWQGNKETRRGDIILHYETAPISSITTIWQSNTNGIIDPFFYYYSEIYLTNKIPVPHISLKELKKDAYFLTHPLVKKNFQGVNGFSFSSEDYDNILRILQDKGFDVERLPKLHTPKVNIDACIRNERDVETALLEPLLQSLDVDWKRQVPIKAGRGHRIFPDYAIGYNEDTETSKAVIEAKFYMKRNVDIDSCFAQARSYANILEADTFILCDKVAIYIYTRSNGFNRNSYHKYYWSELSHEAYNTIKKMIT